MCKTAACPVQARFWLECESGGGRNDNSALNCSGGDMSKPDAVLVREFDAELFHKRVLELEAEGYVANRETYHITPEVDPENGKIVHLHSIEMIRHLS
jgi:hypothetical protein